MSNMNDRMKTDTLVQMKQLTEHIVLKINILDAVDRDSSASSCYDLYDQISSMKNNIAKMQEVIERALFVVPQPRPSK